MEADVSANTKGGNLIASQLNSNAELVRTIVLALSLLLFTAPASGEARSFKCKEPLPEFTLGPTSNPSDVEIEKLCACIWSKLPEGGWERTVAAKFRAGEDPGWRGRAFMGRFGAAMEACEGYKL